MLHVGGLIFGRSPMPKKKLLGGLPAATRNCREKWWVGEEIGGGGERRNSAEGGGRKSEREGPISAISISYLKLKRVNNLQFP